MDYHYPLNELWSRLEIIDVVHFFTTIEKYYERSADDYEILQSYKRFKEIVPSKGEEKTYFKEFEMASGYKVFPVIKQAREQQ
ncbi:hypothetical protein CFK37_16410 [Virgibacillus phasianinus]|uniref:Uncharacterized protein n=1 Tax=Virgibacillus phasianinus TaxID=2017483 RepID=A0A220U681_9BACI|nr:UPF0223 family protein [Virgibacillus phasianinus]ASK63627.1 hypothetical protein CFK37_16410 [Virgibacillus phasianinus]